MNPRPSYAIGTGLFILLGFLALAYLATQTTTMGDFRGGDTYTVWADFQNIGQLKARAPVKIAGVRIGYVKSIDLSRQQMAAKVTLAIDEKYNEIPEDSSASIFTSGLLGDQYVGIQPGGSPDFLKNGSQMILTQSSVNLEDLIGKLFVNGGTGGRSPAPASNTPPASTKP